MRCLLLTSLPLLAACRISKFDINLDLPPRKRWQGMARHFRDDYVLWIQGWGDYVNTRLNVFARKQWLMNHNIPEEYLEEMRGTVEAIDDPRVTEELVILSNFMYELGFPKFCSGILAASSDGTVYHGRTLDYWLPWAKIQTPRGERMLMPAGNVTFWRGGKPVYQSMSQVGSPGIHTGMKLSGHRWSFQQNTHHTNNMMENLEAAKRGGVIHGFFARRLMDEDVDFKTALQRVEETSFAAPHYFVFAGQGSWEGASIEVPRSKTDKLKDFSNVQVLSPQLGRWYVVQTNDRIWDRPEDDRREAGYEMLNFIGGQAAMSHEKMMQLMSTPPIHNEYTLVTYIACPATGRIEGWTADQPADQQAEPLLLQGNLGRKKWRVAFG